MPVNVLNYSCYGANIHCPNVHKISPLYRRTSDLMHKHSTKDIIHTHGQRFMKTHAINVTDIQILALVLISQSQRSIFSATNTSILLGPEFRVLCLVFMMSQLLFEQVRYCLTSLYVIYWALRVNTCTCVVVLISVVVNIFFHFCLSHCMCMRFLDVFSIAFVLLVNLPAILHGALAIFLSVKGFIL